MTLTARPLLELPGLVTLAAELLCTPEAFVQLAEHDAMQIARGMALIDYPGGTPLFTEGEGEAAYLLLVLSGEVSVEAGDHNPIAVVGPGAILGEMALLDGGPRAATCTAVGAVQAAALSRRALERLIESQPQAAARLLAGLSQRLAERLRAQLAQLQLYADLHQALLHRQAA
jgi:CRP-like cAMP-binding protein